MNQEVPTFSLAEPDALREHFTERGFVIVRDVLSVDECLEACEDINRLMKAVDPGFDLWSPDTYDLAPVTASYGMFSRLPIFSPRFLEVRQHVNVHRAFATLFGEEELLVSHDRCAFYRPTRDVLVRGERVNRPEWKTAFTYPEVHLDFNPAVYRQPERVLPLREAMRYDDPQQWVSENNQYCAADGLHVQAVLNLEDNREMDGGYHCVPGFHHRFEDWLDGHVSADANPGGAHRFSARSPNDAKYITTPQRAPCPAGSLVLWDQRLAHGSRPNDSDRHRCIVFLKMFRRRTVSAARYAARREALKRVLDEAGFEAQVTEVGRIVFGLGG
jgi:ectoine hydroxylase-related dioxygenase (phytanoyl-CoA dioxygenase family)